VRLNRNDEFDAVLIRLLPRDISAARMAAVQCLSVRLTVTLVYCIELATDISCPTIPLYRHLLGAHAFLPSSLGQRERERTFIYHLQTHQ